MPWSQDLFSFCALALLLHIGIFVLYITRAGTYYHGPSDVVKRVVNIFMGAFPTGVATVLIFSLVVLLPIINIHAVCVQGTDLLPPPVLFA